MIVLYVVLGIVSAMIIFAVLGYSISCFPREGDMIEKLLFVYKIAGMYILYNLITTLPAGVIILLARELAK